jgi:peptidoglycan hydrolase-like protein with peptidoglycan-binding domain
VTTGKTVAVDRLIDIQTRTGATRVQQRLKVLGFYGDNADGLWGPRSRNALRDFKRSAGLADDSSWNLATQRALWDE